MRMGERAQVLRYLLSGGLAALANYGSRFVFSLWLPFEMSVTLAFFVGLAAGFTLMRVYAFAATASTRSLPSQAAWYVVVNMLALVQTLLISSLLLRWALPMLGVQRFAEATAHAVGVAVPVITSYFGHKRLTFR